MVRRGQWRGGIVRIGAVLAMSGSLTGCHHFTGHSGTCRYGLGAGKSGLGCYSRPKPSRALTARVMSSATLTRALAAWRHAHGAPRVTSVGIDAWAETTIATGRGGDARLATFDVDGRPTKGNDGYVSSPHDAFPIRKVSPASYERLVKAIQGGRPTTSVIRAVISVNPFLKQLTWRLAAVSSLTTSHILYEGTADGGEICHARDYQPKDALAAAPGVPDCRNGVVLPF